MIYYKHADLIRVVDGDTVELSLDLGCRVRFVGLFRLAGINAPERDTLSTTALQSLLNALPKPLLVETHKSDKYGRWLVTILKPDGDTVNAEMIRAGMAVPYDGKTPH